MNPTLGGRNSSPNGEANHADLDGLIPPHRGDLANPDYSRDSNNGSVMSLTSSLNWRHSQQTVQGPYAGNDASAAVLPIQEANVEAKEPAPVNLGRVKYTSDKKRRFSPWLIALNVFIILAIAVVVSLLAVEVSVSYDEDEVNFCRNSNNNEESEESFKSVFMPEPPLDCKNEVDADIIRTIIATEIIIQNNFAILERLDIPCLPEQAFIKVNDESGLALLEQIDSLTLTLLGLRDIEPGAFKGDVEGFVAFPNLRILEISRNGISKIPDNSFSQIPLLDTLILNQNAFVTLDNNIFGNERVLKTFSLAGNSGLIKFPSAVGFLSEVENVDLSDSNALVKLEPNSMDNTLCLRVVMGGSDRILEFFDIIEIGEVLGFPQLPTFAF